MRKEKSDLAQEHTQPAQKSTLIQAKNPRMSGKYYFSEHAQESLILDIFTLTARQKPFILTTGFWRNHLEEYKDDRCEDRKLYK